MNDELSIGFVQNASFSYQNEILIDLDGRQIVGYTELETYSSALKKLWDMNDDDLLAIYKRYKCVEHYYDDDERGDFHELLFFFDDESREIHKIEHVIYGFENMSYEIEIYDDIFGFEYWSEKKLIKDEEYHRWLVRNELVA